MVKPNYTFGDNDEASGRLRRLAEVYEPETRELLVRSGVHAPRSAVDLGCGPGWSTQLLQEELRPARTVGLDSSERYIVEARNRHDPGLEFHVHDVLQTPFPVSSPDVLFCRFLLTHLSAPEQALAAWAGIAAPGAVLLIHETETLEAENASLRRYYELVSQLQRNYGQTLLVGAVLNDCLLGSGWRIIESNRRILEKNASEMAELHAANLRTWRRDEYACTAFDPAEMDDLEQALVRIADGTENGGVVRNAARQIIAQRA